MLSRPSGLILASGLSRRFGDGNKLLVPVQGEPLVRRVVHSYLGAGLASVVVVVGHEAAEVVSALDGLDVVTVHNPEYAAGQSRALIRGVRSLPSSASAAVIGVADQPFLTAQIIRDLIAVQATSGAPIVVPTYGGQQGNPVIFVRSLFRELLAVEGDVGGRPVIARHQRDVVAMAVSDARAGADIDTAGDYLELV